MDLIYVPTTALCFAFLALTVRLSRKAGNRETVLNGLITGPSFYLIGWRILNSMPRLVVGGGLYYATNIYRKNVENGRILKHVLSLAIGLALFSNDWHHSWQAILNGQFIQMIVNDTINYGLFALMFPKDIYISVIINKRLFAKETLLEILGIWATLPIMAIFFP